MKVCFLVALVFLGLVQGKWVPAKISLTSDNAYAVFAGDSNGLVYLGSKYASNEIEIFDHVEYLPAGPFGKNDPTPPKRGLYLNVDQAIYIVAWSDASDNQGLLANVVINGVQISSDNPNWAVYPTGFFPRTFNRAYPPAMPGCTPSSVPFDRTVAFGQDGTAPPCASWVQEQIAAADASDAWEAPTRGDKNDAASLYGRAVDKLPSATKWLWYRSEDCAESLNGPFDAAKPRCQHKEPLIFRIGAPAAAADPTACSPTNNGHFKYCAGQCPFRHDGTAPQCASVYSATGDLKECECCGQCTVVSFDNPLMNYCTGTCENNLCLDCQPIAWGTTPTGQQFIKDCRCQPVGQSDICHLDSCNNECVGGCPNSPTHVRCTPLFSSSNQLIDCYCPNITTTPCQMTAAGTGCVGTCNTAGTPCKGIYENNILRECSCDCCDLLRDPVDPRNNRCIGKCDKIQIEKCQASAKVPVVIDGSIYNITVGCDCF